jgi:uncharacterized protein (TIGR03083 family)
MSNDSSAWVRALRQDHDHLAALAASASAEQLSRQSMATEWTVAQVLSHLGSGAEIGLGTLTGNAVDPPSIWDRWNAMSPAEQAAAFVEADRLVVEWYEALSEDDLGRHPVSLPFLPHPIPAVDAAGFRLSETTLHRWDIDAAFDPEAPLAAAATPLLLERQVRMVSMLARFSPRENRPTQTTVITVETRDPERQFELELGDGMDLRPATGAATSGRLALPGETLVRMIMGRLRPPDDARVTVTGPLSLADLRRAFPGF